VNRAHKKLEVWQESVALAKKLAVLIAYIRKKTGKKLNLLPFTFYYSPFTV